MTAGSALTVFSALAVQTPLTALTEEFTARTGEAVATTFEPTAVLQELIADGARPDVLICTREAMEALAADGVVEGVAPLVTSAIGVAVAPGRPHPDLGDVPRLVAALRSGRVAYSRAGASGKYFAGLLERLGLTDEVNARAVIPDKGFVAEALLDGRADLAVQQLSELAVVPGIEIVGPLPDGAQQRIVLDVAVGSASAHPEAARLFRDWVTSPAAGKRYRAAQLDPATLSS